jgi:hypothetical protein
LDRRSFDERLMGCVWVRCVGKGTWQTWWLARLSVWFVRQGLHSCMLTSLCV